MGKRGDGLEELLVLLLEGCLLLLAQARGVLDGILGLLHLRLEVLDLRLELCAQSRVLLNGRRGLVDGCLRSRDGRLLLLLCDFAKAGHLLVDLLVRLGLLREPRLHVLEQLHDLRNRIDFVGVDGLQQGRRRHHYNR